MNASEISKAILAASLTTQELNQIIAAIKTKQTIISSVAKCSFKTGDRVKFTNSRTSSILEGNIIKINKTKIQVMAGAGIWNVPPTMLSLI